MDKYTVDLDKVLNDFEYSELTDNFNTNRSYTAQTTSTYASSSKSKTGDTKHSITNVFHSLNEYLNSDISGNSKAAKDNKLKENIPVSNNGPYLQRLVETDNSDNKTKDFKSVFSSDLTKGVESQGDNKNSKKVLSECAILTNRKSLSELSDREESFYDVKDYSQNSAYESLIDTDNVENEVFNGDNLIHINPTKFIKERSDVDIKVHVNEDDDMQDAKMHKDTFEMYNGQQSIISAECSEAVVANNIENESIKDSTETLNGEMGLDVLSEKIDGEAFKSYTYKRENKKEDSVCEVPNIATTNKKEEVSSIEIQETVGFDHSFEVDDSALNKYLDELEEEFESHRFEEVKVPSDKNQTEYEDLKSNLSETNVDVLSETQSLILNETSANTSADECVLPATSEAIALNSAVLIVNVRETLPLDVNENSAPNVSGTLSVNDTRRIPLNVAKTESRKDSAYVGESAKHSDIQPFEKCRGESPDGTDKEYVSSEKKLEVGDECVLTREESKENVERLNSVDRPTSLDLSDEHSETASKREINLIGNPGSTPYNNVYVSKELKGAENKTANPEDSDSSISASPTFSEVSTDTVNSTDSTDTEPEDVQTRQERSKSHRGKTNKLSNVNEKDVKDNVNNNNNSTSQEHIDDLKDAGSNYADPTNGNVADSIKESEGNVMPEPDDVERSELAHVDDLGRSVEDSGDASANVDSVVGSEANQSGQETAYWLGKQAPLWIPDSEALSCLHCDARFTVIKRRHHCRACGLVLCSKCCNLKYKLEYLDTEARVCSKCYAILNRDTNSSSGSEVSPLSGNSPHRQANQPNPNNPMEYCSVVPPLQQVSGLSQNPPSVMVPVGVLKRKGSNKAKSNKSVMFCDGIRPGSDLTKLDTDFNYSVGKLASSSSKKTPAMTSNVPKVNRDLPAIDPVTKSFIPSKENNLPPTVTVFKSDITYTECSNKESVVEMLKNEKLTFALQRNLHVHVKIINMDCCINKQAWCFSTEGLISVGQDEIVYLIEFIENEKAVPVDVFHHISNLYDDAVKGTTVTEMGISLHSTPNFLDFKNHAGFLYIRPTFQCLQNIICPAEPYLIGLLIHRWETPWAKIFPLRLVLRLGAEYRYYPSPIISTRHRDSLYVEIGHTIINLLADFRNFSYTLPNIRGLAIHMEDKNTTVTIPENRYDQVMKSLNNSSDHILAFGGNFSSKADSHLVCIQDTQGNNENAYTTHAINIHNKPRKVTGASFIVFNGALKSTSGLTAKSSIVEDGLMIQIPPENMIQVRESLRNMKNHTIQCGCVNAPTDETVHIVWGEPDTNFNIGVTSPIDSQSLAGVPSIRVHNGKDFVCSSDNRLIRWTEVFILQNTDENSKSQDPVDISKIAESISKATCQALVKYLDLLTSNNFYKIGIRTTLHVENVSYSAGSNNIKLPPIYMKNLDNELIPVLHRITSNNLGENAITLELIFRILNT